MKRVAVAGADAAAATLLVAAINESTSADSVSIRFSSVEAWADEHAFASAYPDLILLVAPAPAKPACTDLHRVDQALRARFNSIAVPWAPIYGQTAPERLTRALAAIESLNRPTPKARVATQWQHLCENCSDAVCEQKLLSDLLARRSQKKA
jgi:hypothetical protein